MVQEEEEQDRGCVDPTMKYWQQQKVKRRRDKHFHRHQLGNHKHREAFRCKKSLQLTDASFVRLSSAPNCLPMMR